jgi:triosephosphate isomerase (TIM)
MNKLIIANWKMNPGSLNEAIELAKGSDIEGLVICPPFIYIEPISKILTHAKLGAQDVFFENPPAGGGPYTGEVSIEELKDLGVSHIIVGHSERRELGETDEVIAKKIKVTLENGIIPVLCVGEKKGDRDVGKEKEVVRKQLEIDLFFVNQISEASESKELIIAYEPLWAISKGDASHPPADPEEVVQMINFIREQIKSYKLNLTTRIIYGGSVNDKNAHEFLGRKEIEGALPGGASLDAEKIKKVVEETKK